MKILLTGVNGFIGRYIAGILVKKHHVFGLTRSPAHSTKAAIKFIQSDLTFTDFENQLPGNIDCVIHLAQSTRYRELPTGAVDMRLINIDATSRLLEWSRKKQVSHFIFASTGNVYGNSSLLQKESDSTNPISFYGASKLAAEYLAKQYQEYFKVDILRLFTVFGQDQTGMLIQNMIEKIITGEIIFLSEGKGPYLTPIYIADVVEILKLLIENPSKQKLRLLNVCGNNVVRLVEILDILQDILKIKPKVQVTEGRSKFFTGSPQLLLETIGKFEFSDLRTSLQRTTVNKLV